MRGLRVVATSGAVVVLVAAVLYLRSGDTGSESPAAAGSRLRAQPQASSRGFPKPSMGQPHASSTETELGSGVDDRLARLRDNFEHRAVAAANLPASKREVPALDPRLRSAMLKGVDDDDSDEDPQEMDELRQTLLSDPDPDERVGAAMMLTGEEGPESMRMLLEAMDDPDPEVRLAVVEALGDRAEELSPTTLRTAIRDPNPEVRFEAVTILGDMETRDARKMVENALHDQDVDVRELAQSLMDDEDEFDEPDDPDDAEDLEDAMADRPVEPKGGPPPHVSSRK